MKWLLFILMLNLVGCAGWGVNPWDRDLMAQKSMQFGAESVDEAYTDHIYFSKEGSSGGSGFSGGGCGCN